METLDRALPIGSFSSSFGSLGFCCHVSLTQAAVLQCQPKMVTGPFPRQLSRGRSALEASPGGGRGGASHLIPRVCLGEGIHSSEHVSGVPLGKGWWLGPVPCSEASHLPVARETVPPSRTLEPARLLSWGGLVSRLRAVPSHNHPWNFFPVPGPSSVLPSLPVPAETPSASCHCLPRLIRHFPLLLFFSCSVVSDSVTTWTAALRASLSFAIAQRLLKLMFIESVLLPNHLTLCRPPLCLRSFPASGSFPMSQLFASGGQSIGTSASASVLPMNIQG